MKKLAYILFVTVIYIHVTAQKEIISIVDYQNIIHNENGISFTSPYRLYFNNTVSFYEKIGNPQKLTSKHREERNDGVTVISEDKVMTSSNSMPYYYTNTSNELIFRETLVNKLYEVKDSVESILWKLEQDRKQIGNYDYQKAIARYKGREYTVWFTTEIPVSHGSWTLRGLPGLILEVTEETGKYAFIANTIHMDPYSELLIEKLVRPDTQGIESMGVYIEALKNKLKDWEAIMIALIPREAKPLQGCDIYSDPNNHSLERFL